LFVYNIVMVFIIAAHCFIACTGLFPGYVQMLNLLILADGMFLFVSIIVYTYQEIRDFYKNKNNFTEVNQFCGNFNISKREKEVILLLLQGMNQRNIAENLFISQSTVKTHLRDIYSKCGTTSRFQLFHKIIR